ncbi:hypothetical protein BC670_1273 [Flavobacterium branchiophilum]|uniref:Organic solvent tolerance-like N-terminal domain-containing protein n=2 Tax=Flavobacterium branchiophilum TaxID=55197 RepID=A0A543G2R8_9FLAO|nr:hypothetical protein BC670_1273 [Flavobacterium branchiophilum]
MHAQIFYFIMKFKLHLYLLLLFAPLAFSQAVADSTTMYINGMVYIQKGSVLTVKELHINLHDASIEGEGILKLETQTKQTIKSNNATIAHLEVENKNKLEIEGQITFVNEIVYTKAIQIKSLERCGNPILKSAIAYEKAKYTEKKPLYFKNAKFKSSKPFDISCQNVLDWQIQKLLLFEPNHFVVITQKTTISFKNIIFKNNTLLPHLMPPLV